MTLDSYRPTLEETPEVAALRAVLADLTRAGIHVGVAPGTFIPEEWALHLQEKYDHRIVEMPDGQHDTMVVLKRKGGARLPTLAERQALALVELEDAASSVALEDNTDRNPAAVRLRAALAVAQSLLRTSAPPVCPVCNDTHTMHSEETGRGYMCTRCPVPCAKCLQGGNGPFCGTTPCACECHQKKGG